MSSIFNSLSVMPAERRRHHEPLQDFRVPKPLHDEEVLDKREMSIADECETRPAMLTCDWT